MNQINVLLVDDEPLFLEAIRESLTDISDLHLDCVQSAAEALEKLVHTPFDIIVSDYAMPEMDGIALLKKIRTFSSIPFILFTGEGNEDLVIEAINSGVTYYLKKGDENEVLLAKLIHMIRQGAQWFHDTERLKENERNFRELFEKSPIATIIYDRDGNLTDINNVALTLFGIPSVEEIKQTSLFDSYSISEETVIKLRSGEEVKESAMLDFDEMRRAGRYTGILHGSIYFDISFIPHKRQDGSVTGYYVQIVDLTTQHRAEEELRKAGEQLSLAIDGSQMGTWDWNIQTGETIFNERWAQIIGYSRSELTPTTIQTWEQLTHPDDLNGSYENIQRHFSGELPYYEYEARMRHKDGYWVWIHDRGKVTDWDKDGRPLRMIGTHTDITKRKKAEEELRLKTEQVEQFFTVSLDMLCIANTDGFFTLVNPAWEEVLGWTNSELLSKRFIDFIHPDDIQSTLNAITDLVEQKKVINFVNRYRCKDGTYRWIEWRSTPVQSTIYAAAHDITDLKNNQERLIHKKNILDAISYAATILMSSLSDDAIHNAITRIATAVDVSRAYIFTHSYSSEGTSLISQTYEWTKQGIDPQIQNPALQNLAWEEIGYARWAHVLLNGGVISGIVNDFPSEEQPILVEQDIKSLAVVPIFSHNKFLGFIGFDHCITEHVWSDVEIETLETAAGLIGASFGRKQAEGEVRLRENNLSTFFDTINDFLFVLNMQGDIIKVNETVTRRLGYSEDELIGESILMVHPPKRRQEAFEIVTEMLTKKKNYCPIPLQTKDGAQIPVETRVIAGVWNGEPALFGVSKDISDLTLSEEKFSKAFHASGSLMAISRNGKFIEVNTSFLDTLEYNRDDVIGKSPAELEMFVNKSDQERLRQDMKEKKRSRNNKVLIRGRNGRIVTGILSADLIQIQETTMLLTVMNDVTEITRLSDALLQANKKLNLLSSITRHDILNQVQALIFVEEFIGKKIPEDSSAQDELRMLSKTISTIHSQILFTRDYQDMGVNAPSWVMVKDVVEKERRNKIFTDINIEVITGDLEIFVDQMFSKVCYNLMENALRHGGHVTHISVSFMETPEKGVLVFEDNGTGVVKNEKDLIFKRGFGKNTGLGLFLTSEILSITGITIRETGEEGKGAKFELSIPLNAFRHKP